MESNASIKPYTLRRATLTDLDELVRLRLALFRETNLASPDDSMTDFLQATRAYLAASIPTGAFVAFVAEADGAVVATGGLCYFHRAPIPVNLAGTDAYILNMFTEPDWRGRGIASALVNQLLDYLRTETEVRYVTLHAEMRARPIYERAGFIGQQKAMSLRLK